MFSLIYQMNSVTRLQTLGTCTTVHYLIFCLIHGMYSVTLVQTPGNPGTLHLHKPDLFTIFITFHHSIHKKKLIYTYIYMQLYKIFRNFKCSVLGMMFNVQGKNKTKNAILSCYNMTAISSNYKMVSSQKIYPLTNPGPQTLMKKLLL